MSEHAIRFSSEHAFVVGTTTASESLRSPGTTLEQRTVELTVPTGGSWWVQPLGPLSKEAVGDLRRQSVPGLWLDPGTDPDLLLVPRLLRLRWLKVYDAFPACSDRGLRALGVSLMTQLASLEIKGFAGDCPFTADGIRWLERLPLTRFYADWLTDPLLQALTETAPGLRRLAAGFSPITDRSLDDVANLSRLEVLDLAECTRLTDDCLPRLLKLAELSYLDLEGCSRLSDAGVRRLRSLRSLTTLKLPHGVSDAGVTDLLPALSRLQRLGLEHCTGVGDPSLGVIAESQSLDWLELQGTSITDTGLAALRGLPLRRLELYGTAIGDASVVHLASLTELKKLGLTGTQLSEAGVALVRKALPSCRVDWVRSGHLD